MHAVSRCRIWWARLCWLRPEHLELLGSAERRRRDRLGRVADRDRFTLGAALLRLAAADELGIAPQALIVDRTCAQCAEWHGRPRLPHQDLHVSVSHSGEIVAVATTRAGAVGLDVEQITAIDQGPLLRQVLTPAEAERVSSARDFFVCWTRKESALKATGDGLSTSMTDLVVAAASEPAQLLRYGAVRLPAAMTDLTCILGYAAALTVLAVGPIEVDEREAEALLARPTS